jgi:hypothetical protein
MNTEITPDQLHDQRAEIPDLLAMLGEATSELNRAIKGCDRGELELAAHDAKQSAHLFEHVIHKATSIMVGITVWKLNADAALREQ